MAASRPHRGRSGKPCLHLKADVAVVVEKGPLCAAHRSSTAFLLLSECKHLGNDVGLLGVGMQHLHNFANNIRQTIAAGCSKTRHEVPNCRALPAATLAVTFPSNKVTAVTVPSEVEGSVGAEPS